MRKAKNWWIPVLLGALLMATLVGVAGARPNDRSPEALTRRITVPPGAFHPVHENHDFTIWPEYIKLDSGSTGGFKAQVVFPTGRAVIVEKLILYAYDNNGSDDVCAYLERTDPTAPSSVRIGQVCSSGDSTTDPRVFTDSTISPDEVKHGKGIQVHLYFEDYNDLRVYGVRIEYHNK